MKNLSQIAIIALLLTCAYGCSGSAAPLKAEEKENFKGSEMPPEAREQMNKSIEEWKKKNPPIDGNGPPKEAIPEHIRDRVPTGGG